MTQFSIEKARTLWHLKRNALETICTFNTKKEANAFIEAIGAAAELLNMHTTLLANEPHPKLPEADLTARDYVIWLIHNAQYPGICRALDIIEDAASKLHVYADNVIQFPVERRLGIQGPSIRTA